MIVVTHHLAVAVAQPGHEHLLGSVVVGALRAKIVAEAVESAVGKAEFAWWSGEERTQRRDHFTDENVSDVVGLETAASGTVEKKAVGMARQALVGRGERGKNVYSHLWWCGPVVAA